MNSVPGAADLERKNQYWINYGARRRTEEIIAMLKAQDSTCADWVLELLKEKLK